MTPLRMTRRLSPRVPVLGLCALLAAVIGCGTDPRSANDPTHAPARALLPAPDTERIVYNTRDHSLTFYDLPNSARWVVQLPGRQTAATVGPVHRLPEGIDPEHTLVFYTRPGGKNSNAVSLRQIQDARDVPTSSFR